MHIRSLVSLRAILLAITTALLVFFVLLSIGLYQHIWIIIVSDIFSGSTALYAILLLYLNPANNLTLASLFALSTVALLSAIQALLLYYIYRVRKEKMPITKSMGKRGIIPTLLVGLGMGCSACGSVVILSVLSVFGVSVGVATSTWLTYLLLFSAILILSYSNYRLYQQSKHPLACPI
ncbi:MAG: hypothetical protein ACKKL4_00475 [Patescibacteria group bacterium]